MHITLARSHRCLSMAFNTASSSDLSCIQSIEPIELQSSFGRVMQSALSRTHSQVLTILLKRTVEMADVPEQPRLGRQAMERSVLEFGLEIPHVVEKQIALRCLCTILVDLLDDRWGPLNSVTGANLKPELRQLKDQKKQRAKNRAWQACAPSLPHISEAVMRCQARSARELCSLAFLALFVSVG